VAGYRRKPENFQKVRALWAPAAVDTPGPGDRNSVVKVLVAALAVVPLLFCSCTTLANRRDLWGCRGKVEGPYTRMLSDGVPKSERKVITITRTRSDGKTFAPAQ